MVALGMADALEILERTTVLDDYVRLERIVYRLRAFSGAWMAPCERHVFYGGQVPLCAGVLPYDPVRDVVVLVEQFRLPIHAASLSAGWVLEVVAGRCEVDMPDVVQTAHRELMEEAGFVARHLEKVCTFWDSPGSLAQAIDMFVADVRADEASGREFGLAAEQESTRIHALPFAEALALADAGGIRDGKTLFILNWLARHRDRIRAQWGADTTNG